MIDDKPWMWVITGPNGCGKSSYMNTVASDAMLAMHYFNPDAEVKRLAGGRNVTGGLEWSNFFLQAAEHQSANVAGYAERGESFIVETTAPGLTYTRLARQMRSNNEYNIGVVVLGVASRDVANARMAGRVESGGHTVLPILAQSQWEDCLTRTPAFLKLADEIHIHDNTDSARPFREIARKPLGGSLILAVPETELSDKPYGLA